MAPLAFVAPADVLGIRGRSDDDLDLGLLVALILADFPWILSSGAFLLCALANRFPQFIADFFDHGRKLRRRFREETVTDLLMGGLISMGGRNVIVEFPDEPATGADMQWDFVHRGSNTFFRVMLQAKRLYGDGQRWRRHTYRELFHVSGGALQAVTLCNHARSQAATYPLYIFYNPSGSCQLAANKGVSSVNGINLVDGYLVEGLVTAANSRALRTSNRSLGTLYPYFFTLPELFCPSRVRSLGPMVGIENGGTTLGVPVPRPEDIRERLSRALEASRSASSPEVRGARAVQELPEVPEVSKEIPADVQKRIENHFNPERRDGGGHEPEALDHWRATFVS